MDYKRITMIAVFATGAWAQAPGEEAHKIFMNIPHTAEMGPANTVQYIATEGFSGGKLVKGAPYSADETSETTQTLSDGNRIVRKNSARVYRDKDGRTRTERTFALPGPQAGTGETTIMIDDPVAGTAYRLDPSSRTAVQMPAGNSQELKRIAEAKATVAGNIFFSTHGAATTKMRMIAKPASEPKSETLGKRPIDGIEAEGTRSTMTIPAGDLGNERPIDIVSERWFSPELQTFVLTKRNDPMIGETVFRLSNVTRSDPDPSLFQVPPGYAMKDAAAGERVRIIHKD